MKKTTTWNISLIILLGFLGQSCIPQKNLIYYQDKSQEKKYESPYHPADNITESYLIRTNDYLFIQVMTPNSDVQQFYNIMGGSSMGTSSSTTQTGGSRFTSYMVDDEGKIDFPNVGLVEVGGMTRKAAKAKLETILKGHISDFTLQVHLSNTHFTLLGEAKAGNYPMIKDQMTIWEALGESGDLTTYSKRQKIKIIRPMPNGKSKITEVNLTDLSLLDSQESYIYPNDIIYVEPLRSKMFGFGETFSLGILTSVITFYLLIQSLVS